MAKSKASTRVKANTTTKRTSEVKASNRATKEKAEEIRDVNPVEVRRNITNIVGEAASKIAIAVVGEALKGQLATAKYLFEAAGIYPLSTEGIVDKPEEDSFAQRLVRTLGLPEGPLPSSENNDPLVKVVIPIANDVVPEEKKNSEGHEKAVEMQHNAVAVAECE